MRRCAVSLCACVSHLLFARLLCAQYLFYQSVRDQVSDVLDCLTDKAPDIEDAADELKEIKRAHGKAVRESAKLNAQVRSSLVSLQLNLNACLFQDEAEEAFPSLRSARTKGQEVNRLLAL